MKKAGQIMDLKIQAKAAEHIYSIAARKTIEPAVKFSPVKSRFPRENIQIENPLPRCNPEDVGVSSRLITAFLKEVAEKKNINVHQIMVVKNGKVISEAAFAPYKLDMWHVTHSACKTVTAMAIGILIKDGALKLSDRVVKIFDDICPAISKIRLNKITVEHLLTMSSGIVMNELVIVGEKDWLKAFLESSCKFEPGSKFHYNSLNSYVLSCIVEKITGVTMFDFLQERLFAPLGIKTVSWESCPMGRTKGGWGMYLMPEDMAKLALFIMRGAKIKGKAIISKEYIAAMTSKRMDTEYNEQLNGYGYQAWMGTQKDSWFFNGMLGQNICCMPATDTVVVTTGGSDKLFGNGPVNQLVEKYFAPDYPEKFPAAASSYSAVKELRNTEKSLENSVYALKGERLRNLFAVRNPLPREAKALDGKSYEFDRKFVRLQPLFTQILNNSYSEGIDKICFSIENGRFILTVHEGRRKNKIPLSFGSWVYSSLNVNGEVYEVAVTAGFTTDEDDNPVLKVMLPFIEHSDGRMIKLHFLPEGRVMMRFFEFPGGRIMGDGLDFAMDSVGEFLAGQISSRVDMELIKDLVDSAFEPVVYGKLM